MLANNYKETSPNSGDIIIFALVFISVFLVLAIGLLSFTHYHLHYIKRQETKNFALHIAEAGVNYYRWHLAHDQDNFTSDVGLHDYEDPITGAVGKFDLEVIAPSNGSTIVRIKSTGWLNADSMAKRQVAALYGLPSLAHYSYLTNSDIWFGSNENVSGIMHSNGGIRQDGTNDSLMTSAKETYTCQPNYGCNPSQTKPGIWGAGPNFNLWSFPVPTVDFNAITVDLSDIRDLATSSGLYFGSTAKGYHLIFLADGNFNLYRVNQLKNPIRQCDDNWDDGCRWLNIAEEIKNETLLQNYAPPGNGLIFIEDNVWVEGTINGRITLVSAKLPDTAGNNTSIFINGNLNYLARDGNHILGLIAQKDIKVPRHAPSDLVIDGILLAQKGRCFRNVYLNPSIKTNIEVYGGIITNKTWTWTWVSMGGTVIDGYTTTNTIYDNRATFMPPPHFPTAGEYTFISWEEIE